MKPKGTTSPTMTQKSTTEIYHYEKARSFFLWGRDETKTILNIQFVSVIFLTWLVIIIEGSNFKVETTINSPFVPLWPLWFFLVYTMSITVGYTINKYPSHLGIILAILFQFVTTLFSAYFECHAIKSLQEHGQLDENPISRLWGSVLYSTIIVINGLMILSAVALSVRCVLSDLFVCRQPETASSTEDRKPILDA